MKKTFISIMRPSAPLSARYGGGWRDAIRPFTPEGGGRKESNVRRVGDSKIHYIYYNMWTREKHIAEEVLKSTCVMKPVTRVVETNTHAMKPVTRVTETDTRVMKPVTRVTETDTRVMKPVTRVTETNTRVMKPVTRVTETNTRVTETVTCTVFCSANMSVFYSYVIIT
jgi:hypothetical protein